MTNDELRALADALETTGRPGGICQQAANYLRAQADAEQCWCHKCNEGRLVNGIPFAATQMIVCPICGNKRCPHASDHALACTASNDPMAVSAAPQAEQYYCRDHGCSCNIGDPIPEPEPKRKPACLWSRADEDTDTWETACGHAFTLNDGTPTDNQIAFCCYCGRELESETGDSDAD